jgi:AcrR family transcriptional regulator
MPAVAGELGVSTQALYRYFPSRDALLEALGDDLLGRVKPASHAEDWREWMAQTAITTRRELLLEPGLIERIRVSGRGKHALALMDRSIGVLTTAGFSTAEALRAYQLVTAYLFRAAQLDSRRPTGTFLSPQLVAAIESHPDGALPHLRRLVATVEPTDRDTVFKLNLDALLAGIEATRSRR